MPKKQAEQLIERNKKIRVDYEKWCNKKYKEVRKFTDVYIFAVIAEKYYLSAATVENIIFYRDSFSRSNLK